MPAELQMRVLPNKNLSPIDQSSRDLLKSFSMNEVVKVKVTRMRARNYVFLQKFMCLMQVGFDAFNPPEMQYKGITVEKNFDRFRGDVMILAGHYIPYYNARGEVRLQPKSVSYASMEEEEFEQVYSQCIDVLIKMAFVHYTDPDEINRVVDHVLGFA